MRRLMLSILLLASAAHAEEDLSWLKAPAKPPVIATFSGSSPIVNGAASTLTISASGADTCSIDQGVGAVSCSGTASVSPSATTTYTLTATSAKGKTATATASVTVAGLIREDAGTFAHVTFNGSSIVDWKGNTWTQNGTVPQVAASGSVPPGAGPFSDQNFYSATLSALNSATNFTGVLIFKLTTKANGPVLFYTNNFYAEILSGGQLLAGPGPTTANAISNGQYGIICWGKAGTVLWGALDNGTAVSASYSLSTASAVRLGRYSSANFALDGTVYELLLTTTAPSAAVCSGFISGAHGFNIGWPW